MAVGECKWQQRVSAAALRTGLLQKVRALPRSVAEPEVIICGRDDGAIDAPRSAGPDHGRRISSHNRFT